MATIAHLVVDLSMKADAFERGLENSAKNLNKWGKGLRDIGKKMTLGVTTPVVAGFTKMVLGAAELEQSIGATGQLWGDNADEIIAWAAAADKSMGLTQNQALSSVNNFNAMFKQLDAGADVVQDMSQRFTGLSADLSAMWGGSTIEASESLTSALRGNYEGLDKYNINLTEAMVSQEAMNVAIADGRDEITEADKLQARYNLILEQTADAQGQFAKESNTTSGRLAILRARIGNLATNIGRLLLPYVNKLADFLSKIVDWLEKTDDSTRKWVLGIAAVAAAMGPLLIVLGMMLPGLGALLTVIAALVSPIGLVIAAVGLLAYAFRDEIGAAIGWLVDRFGEALDTFREFREMGLSPVQAALAALQVVFPALGAAIAPLRQMVENLGDAFQALKDGDFGAMFDALGRAARNVGASILNAIRAIDWGAIGGALSEGFQGLVAWVSELDLEEITVNVASWAAGKIKDIWGWLKGVVFGSAIAGDGTGGPMDTTGQLTLADIAVNVFDWVEGTIADVAAKLKEWIEDDGPVKLAGVIVDIAAPQINRDEWPAWNTYDFWFGKPGTNIRDIIDNPPETYETPDGGTVTIKRTRIERIWNDLMTSKDFWFGKRGTFLRDLIDGRAATITVGGQAITIEEATLNRFWETISSMDFWFGKPGTWLRDLIDGDPMSIDLLGGEVNISAPSINWPWSDDPPETYEGVEDSMAEQRENEAPTSWEGVEENYEEQRKRQNTNPFMQPAVRAVQEWAASIGAALTTAVDHAATFRDRASASFTATKGAFDGNLTPLPGLTGAMASGMTAAALPAFASIQSSATSQFAATRSAITSNMSTAASVAGQHSGTMRSVVSSHAQAMASAVGSAASNAASRMGAGMATASGHVATQAGRWAGIVSSNGSGAASTAYSIGANIGNSVASGMESALQRIGAAAGAMIDQANKALSAKALIASPSRLFMRLGEHVGEGFEQGIRNTIPSAARAAGDLVNVPNTPHLGADSMNGGQVIQIITLEPGKWQEFLHDAQTGGTFARQFGGELAMMGGKV